MSDFKTIPVEEQLAHIRRGAVDVIVESELVEKLKRSQKTGKPLRVKAGFDPTAPDIHVGHTVLIRKMKHFQELGHVAIFLIGDFTGLIGDPSGKAGERALNPKDTVAEWADRLKRQVGPFLDLDGRSSAILLDNYEWLSRLDLITFLRDVGKHFPIGAMMARESVRGRMGRDAGLSYTEFSYQVLQAYDFLSLLRTHDCTVQMGGTDQWGNITAGVDLIRRLTGRSAFGITLPLVTKTDGTTVDVRLDESFGLVVVDGDSEADDSGDQ